VNWTKMRKLFALAMVALLAMTVALAVVGCGQQQATEEAPPPAESTMPADTSAMPMDSSEMPADTMAH
jgi:hypothetical protein